MEHYLFSAKSWCADGLQWHNVLKRMAVMMHKQMKKYHAPCSILQTFLKWLPQMLDK